MILDNCYAEAYTWNSLLATKVYSVFDEKLWDNGEDIILDPTFDWVLVDNMVVLPESYMRIGVGAGGTCAGTSQAYVLEAELLHTFKTDVMVVIANKVKEIKKLKHHKNKIKYLSRAILELCNDFDEDSFLEYMEEL